MRDQSQAKQFRHHKLKVLIFVDYYLPGYKAGGPLKTISNLVNRLGDEICFNIITRDRDFGDSKPYYDSYETWSPVGKAMVCYLSPKQRTLSFIRKLLSETAYDVLYLNSLFSPVFTSYPLILHLASPKKKLPVIIAPRGETSPSALKIKSGKKKPFLLLARLTGLYDSVKWHASSQHEFDQIHKLFDKPRRLASVSHAPSIAIAPDLAPHHEDFKISGLAAEDYRKDCGALHIVFLSRITRMKNLDGALRMLQGVDGAVRFDIYGPIDDPGYWSECEKLVRLLPSNIEVRYRGVVDSKEVLNVLQRYHLFYLPTLGENFGHAILEAFIAGCPVLISDRTLWLDLERKGVGWDIPLDKPEKFHAVLQQCVHMDQQSLYRIANQAREFGLAASKNNDALQLNRNLFYVTWSETSGKQAEDVC